MTEENAHQNPPAENPRSETTAESAGQSQGAEALSAADRAVKRSLPMGLSIAVGILLAALTGWFFYHLTWFMLLVYLSLIAATILEAPVQWLKRLGIRRTFAAVIVMVGGLVIIIGLGYLLANGVYRQVSAVSTNLERAPERINTFVNNLVERLPGYKETAATQKAGTIPGATQPATTPASTQAFNVAKSIRSAAPSLSTIFKHAVSGVQAIIWLVIMFFIVLYMLVEGAHHLRAIRGLLPKESRLEATKLFHEISHGHRGWALASLSNVASSTILTSTGLWLLGVPGAVVLGFFAGLGELVPNIGPLLGAMPALLLTLVASPDKFLYVVGMFLIVQTIQSYTITPMMMKFSVELPVLVTIISVLVFGTLFGFLGVIVAIPLVADMVVIWNYTARRREKDTTDYDEVNSAPGARRRPASPDNTPVRHLRKMLQRRKQRRSPPELDQEQNQNHPEP